MSLKRNKVAFYGNVVWTYTKYQVLTKLLLFFAVFPVFKFLLRTLIFSTGRVSISSGDYVSFLFSIQGIGFLLVSFFILILLIGIDINAFIIMSALIKENRIKLKAKQLLVVGIKSLKSFLTPSGLLISLYIGLILPLLGVGFGVSVTKNFKIPNFIADVIFKNPIYLSLYSVVMLALTVISIIYVFFFHYLIIDKQTPGMALSKSSGLMRRHWKAFLKESWKMFVFYMLIIGFLTLFLGALFAYSRTVEDLFSRRTLSLFIGISVAEIFAYAGIMTVPFICYQLTDLFYKFNQQDGYKITLKQELEVEEFKRDISQKIRFRTKFSLVMFFVVIGGMNLLFSLFGSAFFDEIFRPSRNILIVAHRGGGDLAAENSIAGMQEAAKEGAQWSEIDVQRTMDGYYIINHDATFARVAENNKKSTELTLHEIRQLKIKDLFNPQRNSQSIPTLEEYLDAAKGKIGLFIELKGSSADRKMVDDVVMLVKEKNMEKEVAILSLDYQLIVYTEEKYPEIDTGYLYFFSIGDTKNLTGDILIMEEQEATEENIAAIHRMGKKAIVWTVNTDESIKKFVASDIDGIITDYVIKLKEGMRSQENKSDLELIIESIIE